MSFISRRDMTAWALMPTTPALTYNRSFAATGAGSTTTIVSTTLGAAFDSNDDLVGKLIEVKYCAAGQGFGGAGIRVKILAFVDSTSTLTVETLPFATADGDTFDLFDVNAPDFVEDTGTSTTTVSTARDEADDYWIGNAMQGGPYMVAVNATDITEGSVKLISDWTSSSGDATCAAFDDSTVIGDYFQALIFPEVTGKAGITHSKLDRWAPGKTVRAPSPLGLREGQGGPHELMFRGPGAGRVGDEAECHVPFAAVMTATSISDVVVDTGSTTSAIEIASGTPVAGGIYCTEEGDVFVASAVAGSTVTPSPTLRQAPTVGTTIYGGQRYTPLTTLSSSVFLQEWLADGYRTEMWGCVPQVTMDMERGMPAKISLNWVIPDGYSVARDDSGLLDRSYDAIRPSVDPVSVSNAVVKIGTNEYCARKASIDLGADVQVKTGICGPNGVRGCRIVTYDPTITVEIWLETDAKDAFHEMIQARTQSILVQNGTSYGSPGILAFHAEEAEISAYDPAGDDGGSRYVTLTFRPCANTNASLSHWAVGVF